MGGKNLFFMYISNKIKTQKSVKSVKGVNG